jgi:2-methylcitrate dehydratase PrpD
MSAVIQPNAETAAAETIAERFAAFARRFDISDVPAEVLQYAKLCFADAVGIGIASNSYDFADKSTRAIAGLAGSGPHPVIGRRERLPLRDAALLNGLLVHGLDFDDTHPASVIHCSASAVPLVLALGAERGVSGARALAAYLLALEADARIGQVADGQFQKVGLHPTGAVGIFGGALAAAYLDELDERQTAYAQGIALSMSAGSLEFLEDGAWTKRMHPGWAASSAITAAALAGQDFQAPLKVYEGRYGLYSIYLQGRETGDLAASLDGLGRDWETMTIAIKPYPVCHFNHAFIDAALEIQQQHGLQADDVAEITALIHPGQSQVVCEPLAAKRRPGSDYDGKFSLPFVVAAALVRGRFTLDELEDDALNDPAILALCDRIGYEHDETSAYPRYYSGELRVKTSDGRELAHREAVNRGADSRPLSEADVHDKFMSNAQRVIDAAQAEQVWQAVMNLDQAPDLGALTAVLGAQGD